MRPKLRTVDDETEENPFRFERIRVEDLINDNPTLNEPVIDGWVRSKEVANIIAAPKFGKSWFAYYLMFCIATGQPVFGRHPVKFGRVLLIDLELHKSLIASRLKTVAAALGLTIDDYAEFMEVVSLRGNWKSMPDLLAASTDIMPGEFVAIIIDSKYRLEAKDENANVETTTFYNQADSMADMTGAAVLIVHHQTKGDQSGKRTTDIGSGGGAQSRAADTHLVLREHEDNGVAVIDGAVRSFAPLEPLAIRWQFPLWMADEWADPSKLAGKQTKSEERQIAKDKEGRDAIVKALLNGPLTRNDICTKAGMGKDRFNRLIGQLEEDGHVVTGSTKVAHNDAVLYRLNQSDSEGGLSATDHQTRPPDRHGEGEG